MAEWPHPSDQDLAVDKNTNMGAFSNPSVIIIKIQKMGPKMIFLNRKSFFKKNVLDSQIEIFISNSMCLNNFFLCCLDF